MNVTIENRPETVKTIIFIVQILITGFTFVSATMAIDQAVSKNTAPIQDWFSWITGPFGALFAVCFVSYVLFRMYRQNDKEYKKSLIERAEKAEKERDDTKELLRKALENIN